jgi:hypothetical protein
MRVQRVLMPGSGAESWTLLGEDHVRWSRSSGFWRSWRRSSVRRTLSRLRHPRRARPTGPPDTAPVAPYLRQPAENARS